jgi:hypothetical protein
VAGKVRLLPASFFQHRSILPVFMGGEKWWMGFTRVVLLDTIALEVWERGLNLGNIREAEERQNQ